MILLLLLKITKYKSCKHKLSKETRLSVRRIPGQLLRFGLVAKQKVLVSHKAEDVERLQLNRDPNPCDMGTLMSL
jgi:hypothetical protein